MAVTPIALVIFLLPTALVVGLLAALGRPSRAPQPTEAVEAAVRHARVAAGLAPVAGLVACIALALPPHPAAVPALYLLSHTVVLAVGEVTWPRPQGQLRRASLRPRSVRSVLPPRITWAAAVTGTLLVVVLLVGEVTGVHTASRFVVVRGNAELELSPYPSGPQAAELAVTLLVTVALTVLALGLVVSRASIVGATPEVDTAVRRASAHRFTRGILTSALFALGGCLQLEGGAWANESSSNGVRLLPGWLHATGTATFTVGSLVMLAAALSLVWRTPAARALPPATAAAPATA